MLAGGQHEDFVARLDAGAAVAAHEAVGLVGKAPVDGHDAHRQLRVVHAHVADAHAYARRPQPRAHRGQAGTPAGELAHLQGIGVLDELQDVAHHRGFGADDGVHRKALGAQQRLRHIEARRPHARHAGAHAEHHVGDLAADQVGFVLGRAGDQQVGVGGAGLGQHLHVNAVAHDPAQVEPVLQLLQALGIGVDDGDVIALGDQALRHAVADPARPQDDDLHALSL